MNEGRSEPHELLPVRMLTQFAYCARLFHLMHVEGRWADNVFTEEGRRVHRRVDRLDHVLPEPKQNEPEEESRTGDDPPEISRSVSLGSEDLGLTAKLDLVSTAGDEAVPVETKRGRVPDNPERSWEPERIQLMAQGLLLREHGYRADHGVLYFARSRTRVDVPFTGELEVRTRELIEAARAQARRLTLPEPLDDSPKCVGCSLAGICLPDETLALRAIPRDEGFPRIRRLYPGRDDAVPLYVQEQGAVVGKSGRTLVIRKRSEELARARLKEVSQLVLCGSVSVTPQTVHLLAEAGVPIVHLSTGHWFYGITTGPGLRNAFDRAAQYRHADDTVERVRFGQRFVTAKGTNQRTLLRRNHRPSPTKALRDMKSALHAVESASSEAALLGLEGRIAALYYGAFAGMLRPRTLEADWGFRGRNRRPPRDPVNALLSFGYAMLAKECSIALQAEGLDPWWGLYHRPRHGRPALALDLMEEFRPVVVDSAVLTSINTGMIRQKDFIRGASSCALKPAGRKRFLEAYAGRLDRLMTHPRFDYRCSWRVAIRLQARILARTLRGDVPDYVGIMTR